MKKHYLFYLFLLLIIQSTNAQDYSTIPIYDELIELEGMEYSGGITFYIEKKSENLVAIQNGIIKWKVDVIEKCSKRKKKRKITFVSIISGNVKVSFGKNNLALVNIENGEIECLIENKDKKIVKKKIEFSNFKE